MRYTVYKYTILGARVCVRLVLFQRYQLIIRRCKSLHELQASAGEHICRRVVEDAIVQGTVGGYVYKGEGKTRSVSLSDASRGEALRASQEGHSVTAAIRMLDQCTLQLSYVSRRQFLVLAFALNEQVQSVLCGSVSNQIHASIVCTADSAECEMLQLASESVLYGEFVSGANRDGGWSHKVYLADSYRLG